MKALLRIASMQSMLLLGPPRKIFKITCSEIESKGIFMSICSYRDNPYISCTHIIAICSFTISTSITTGSHL